MTYDLKQYANEARRLAKELLPSYRRWPLNS